MPRKPRAEFEKGVYHVYARGNGRRAIYLDDADRSRYLTLLGRVATRMRWRCLAYCLMTNHVHVLVETQRPNLGVGIQRVHASYAQAFNHRHTRSGHLFQGRFGSVALTTDEQLWTTAAYIARNPVEAALCGSATEWPWSSHAAMVAGSPPDWLDVERLLFYFAGAGGDPHRRYVEFIGR